MPELPALMRFLASSITFMTHLEDVAIFFNRHHIGQINKSHGQSQAVPILKELTRFSPEKSMIVESVQQHRKSAQHSCSTLILMLDQSSQSKLQSCFPDMIPSQQWTSLCSQQK